MIHFLIKIVEITHILEKKLAETKKYSQYEDIEPMQKWQ